MSFERPAFLWLLAALAPLAAAFLLRRRRPRVLVPDLDAWLAVVPRRPARGWRTLRDAASLLLNAAAAAALALAAAGPRAGGKAGEDWALIFDTSASMGAADGRWRRSLELAEGFVAGLPAGDRYRVIEAGAVARARGGWRAGGEPLPAMPAPGEPAGDVAGALALAPGARTIVFSDCEAPGAEFAPRVASPAENRAVTSLSWSRAWASPQVEAAFTVRNFGSAPAAPVVRVSCGTVETAVALAAAPPGAEVAGTAVLEASAGGLLEVRLRGGDGLAADDAACAVVPPLRRARVRVLAPAAQSPFFRAALAALAPALDPASGIADAASAAGIEEGGADLLIYDRCAPARLRSGAALLAGADIPGFGRGPAVENPAITACAADHPLLQGLDLSRLRVARARPFARDPALRVLVDSAAGPLAVAGERDGLRFAALAFALEDSNLPLLAAFPLLVRNALDRLAREQLLPPAQVGDWAAPFDGPYRVWQGGVEREHAGPWRAARPGLAVFSRGDLTRSLAVNFFNPAESALAPPPPGTGLPRPPPTLPPLWIFLAVAGAAALLLDWTVLRRP